MTSVAIIIYKNLDFIIFIEFISNLLHIYQLKTT